MQRLPSTSLKRLIRRLEDGAARVKMRIEQSVEESRDICRFRFRGECDLVEATELVRKALAYCRERAVPKLFVDGTALTGVPIPSLIDRFLMAEEWAQEARGVIVMVLVVQPQYIHPEKFGVKVAQDLGFMTNVFPGEAEALAWLAGVAAT
jgi:hypothetical protein